MPLIDNLEIYMHTFNDQKFNWMARALSSLAGAHPSVGGPSDPQAAYQDREEMKKVASTGVGHFKGYHASFRAPYWTLWAFSHWCRASESVDLLGDREMDEIFPFGIDFRRYLAAWLWSVGIPQLDMTPADLEAVQAMTGVAPLPHPLMPTGSSEFMLSMFVTSAVEAIPAAHLTAANVVAVFTSNQPLHPASA